MQDKSTQNHLSTTKRSGRNRKRSKRRSIFCPTHSCYLESESPKYRLSDLEAQNNHDKERLAEFLLSLSETQNSENIQATWVEAFWCPQCEKKRWYHITETGLRCYDVAVLSDSFCVHLENNLENRTEAH